MAIKAAMIVVLSSFELVNVAYYILLPWHSISSSDAVAVAAVKSVFGRWAGILISILVALSCAGSVTSNVFTIGRLTVAASQRQYLPSFLSKRGFSANHGTTNQPTIRDNVAPEEDGTLSQTESASTETSSTEPTFDAPMYVTPPEESRAQYVGNRKFLNNAQEEQLKHAALRSSTMCCTLRARPVVHIADSF